MGNRWIDRGLVAAALLLGAVILAGALSHISLGGHRAAQPATTAAVTQPIAPLPAPKGNLSIVVGQSDIELHGSPETQFLRRCDVSLLRADVRLGQTFSLTYDGPPCHLPRFDLTAVVRDGSGRVLARRPGLDPGLLPGAFAGGDSFEVPLAQGLLRCWAGPVALRASELRRVASGSFRCRGEH